MKLIVTAGGQGTKIWPLSREAKPKQFQAIVGKKPLYQQTVDSLLKSFNASDIYISTKKRYHEIAQTQSPQIPDENYIFEPDAAKDRGPGEGLAFLKMQMLHPDEPFMIIQSDVLRVPEEAFLTMIKEAEKVEIRDKKFMSGGIKATYPIMGVDYLRLGKRILSNNIEIYKTDEFIPRNEDYQKTKQLIHNFHVAVHSNHMCWYPDLMMDAYQKFRPDWYEALMKIKDILVKDPTSEKIDAIYETMEAGATEIVTNNIIKDSYTILLPFKWTDIGTWDSVFEFIDPDGGVHVDANAITIDTQDTLIKSDDDEKLIAVCGLKDLVVVDTKDALLICSKTHAAEVKQIVKILKEKKLKKYL